jgi:hypothetical protein
MANKQMIATINELKDAEAVLIMTAKKCSSARRVLERAAGLSQAPAKGGRVNEAMVVHITTQRRKSLLRKNLK